MTRISAANLWMNSASLAEVLMIAPRRKRNAPRDRIADTAAVTELPARGDRTMHACVKPVRFYPAGIDVASG